MKKLVSIVLCGLPVMAAAQNDSIPPVPVELKEIVIQSEIPNRFVRDKRNTADIQNPTDKLLSQTMGVSMIRRGNFGWEPTIRGLNAGQINMTIDGMAIFGACTDRMDPVSSYIEPNNLQSILVSYSTGEAAAGSTIGGGFDFKIRKPVLGAKNPWSGMAGLGYEHNGHAVQTLAAVTYSGARLAVNANGIFRSSGNYYAGGNKEIPFSQYHKWNAGIAAKYQLATHHFLTANYIQDQGYDIGYPGLTMDVAYAKAKIISLAHLYENPYRILDRWETKVYFNHIDHAMDDSKRPAEQVPMHMDMPGVSTTMGFYTLAHLNLDNQQQITARLSGYRNRQHASMTMYPGGSAPMYMLTLPDAERSTIGLHASDRLRLTNRLTIILGLQTEIAHSAIYTDEGQRALSGITTGSLQRTSILYNGYLNGAYQIAPQWSITAQVARGMRPPTLKELYSCYIFAPLDGYDYIGNPGLQKETSWNVTLGATFQNNPWRVSVRGFGYFFNNYIAGIQQKGYQPMTHEAKGVKRYRNLATAQLTGIEATLEYRPFPRWAFISKNAFEYGRDRHNRALPRIPPFHTTNTIQYRIWGIGLKFTGHFAAAQHHINKAFYGTSETPAYAVFNVSAGRNFSLGATSLSIHLSVENLLDNQYYTHLDVSNVLRPGRNFITHITFRF